MTLTGLSSDIPLPEWVVHGAVFALDGKIYRVLSVGSTNRRSHDGRTFEPRVLAEPVTETPWTLPATPVTKATLSSSIRTLLSKPSFYIEDLKRAIHMVRGETE